jgi:DNA-binding beta-propeller fold protein YncE
MKSLLLALSFVLVAGVAPQSAPPVPQVAKRISLPDGGWDILTVDPEGHRVLIGRSDGVDAIDTVTGAVTSHLISGTRFHGVIVVPRTDVAVATEAAGTVVVFNRVTGKVTAEIKTDPDADALLYEPVSRRVWVMNGDSGAITTIDPLDGKVVDEFKLGSALEFAATDGRGHVFVNLSDEGKLAAIFVDRRIPDMPNPHIDGVMLPGCQHPTGLAYVNPGILISACANGVAKLVRARDLKVIGDIAIGPRPDGAFADEARHRAYIPSGGDGTLAVIDTSGPLPHKIATVQTETGARTGAVDPSTGTVYSIAAKFGPPPAGGGRPPIVPGTVELIVIR